MARLVTGLFNTRSAAMLAIEDLMRHGIPQDDISLLMTDTNVGREFYANMASKAPEGGVTGTIIGGIIGGVLAALIARGYINMPAVGLAGVSLAIAILAGLAVGAIIGLIIGAAIGASIPEYEMNLFRADKRHGGILVGTYAHVRREGEVRRLMEAAGGHDIRTKNVRDERLPERRGEFVRAGEREVTR